MRSINPFPLRLPGSLRTALEASAQQTKRSLNSQVVFLLSHSLETSPGVGGTDVSSGPYLSKPLGVRMPQPLREALQSSADAGDRSLNSEIVSRLTNVLCSANTPGIPAIAVDEQFMIAWARLGEAVDALQDASLAGLPSAMGELYASKHVCDVLLSQHGNANLEKTGE